LIDKSYLAACTSSRQNMRLHAHKQTLIVLARYFFLVSVAQVGVVLWGSFLKGAAFLTFAFLLLFVVGRSANLWKAVTTCFRALPVAFFASFTNPRWTRAFYLVVAAPAEPCLAPRYQRPPPLMSL
jgi:hypothetical protein